MRHIFVINPRSGPRNVSEELCAKLSALLPAEAYTVYVTHAPGDATRFVKEICAQSTEPLRFYACGGDGTLNEVVNGAAGYAHAAVGCYPCGSGNDFVKYFGGKRFFLDLKALLDGDCQPVDLMRVNDRYAINVVNFGFDATVASRMIRFRRLRLLHGQRAYYCAIIQSLLDSMRSSCRVIADSKPFFDGALLLCTLGNGDYVGGSFRCAPRADVHDGRMEVCAVLPMSRLRFARMMGIYQRGEHLDSPLLTDCVRYVRAQRVEIQAAPGFLMCLDGEILTGDRFVVETLPQALRFIVPKGAAHPGQALDLSQEK